MSDFSAPEEKDCCRICQDSDIKEALVNPCQCSGSVGSVHGSCLSRWLADSGRSRCELCGVRYAARRQLRTPSAVASICEWLSWRRHGPRACACALLALCVAIAGYGCLLAADWYSQAHPPPALWTTMSLLVTVSLLVLGYFLWLYFTLLRAISEWYMWWQSESSLTLDVPQPSHVSQPRLQSLCQQQAVENTVETTVAVEQPPADSPASTDVS